MSIALWWLVSTIGYILQLEKSIFVFQIAVSGGTWAIKPALIYLTYDKGVNLKSRYLRERYLCQNRGDNSVASRAYNQPNEGSGFDPFTLSHKKTLPSKRAKSTIESARRYA